MSEKGKPEIVTCMYLSLMFSQEEMQFDMYRWMNSGDSSAAVVSRLTTSIEWSDISIFTRADKKSFVCGWFAEIKQSRHSMAIIGLFSTSSGNCCGVRSVVRIESGSALSSATTCAW